jgi:hypothetical protein
MTDVSPKREPISEPLRYLDFLRTVYETPEKILLLEAVEQRLLALITVHAYKAQPLSVMQVLMSQNVLFIGASTISRKIDLLRSDGWIYSTADEKDRRLKYLYPTEKTLNYFAQVSQLMAN